MGVSWLRRWRSEPSYLTGWSTRPLSILSRTFPNSYDCFQCWSPARIIKFCWTACGREWAIVARSEEHTSELQSLMRTSYAVFCLKINTVTKMHHACFLLLIKNKVITIIQVHRQFLPLKSIPIPD